MDKKENNKIINNIKKSNLPVDTKKALIDLLNEKQYEKFIKLFIEIFHIGASILDAFNLNW